MVDLGKAWRKPGDATSAKSLIGDSPPEGPGDRRRLLLTIALHTVACVDNRILLGRDTAAVVICCPSIWSALRRDTVEFDLEESNFELSYPKSAGKCGIFC
jgi:hypothetical protein